MRRFSFIVPFALVVLCIAVTTTAFTYLLPVPSSAQGNNGQTEQPQQIRRGAGKRMSEDKAGIERLKNKTNGTAEVKISQATGAARFINFAKGRKGDLSGLDQSVNAKDKSIAFFDEYGSLFGIDSDRVEMRLEAEKVDDLGNKHQTFKQFYKGVPVFAGVLLTHYDKQGQLNTVNGNAVPEIEVETNPSVAPNSAATVAKALVAKQKDVQDLIAKNAALYVYRTGLAENVPGNDYLAYEIEVTNNSDVREFVYVDAHSNKIVDQFTGITDALNRRAFNGNASYPNTPFWVEGQPFPTGDPEADNMILSSKETYDFFFNAFGRDSFGNTGNTMDMIFNRTNACPNASWNGTFISFCPGLTVDDVTAHEWAHAYTQYTHGLIYAYQPGALNEAYSDIWGETIDRINNRDNIGNSQTDAARTVESCSTYSPSSPRFFVNSPPAIAGQYGIGRAAFGPGYTSTGVTGDVVIAEDPDEDGPGGANTATDACSPLTNAAAVAGKIALIDRGVCGFKLKTKNAQDAGAVGVIIANNAANANSLVTMADDPTITTPITIPAVNVLKSTGDAIRSQLNVGVNVTIRATENSDASTRWLLGEDSTAAGLTGALRDMYNPTCYSNPGKVSDTLYYNCEAYPGSDNGGVHGNSGVPNHAFALLVDGGTYNGQTINAIGLTKASHVYYRAMTAYQVPNTNFIDHADSLEQSATDFIASRTNLRDLRTGLPSGEIVTQNDLQEIRKAMLAVEMRKAPTQCGIDYILDKNTPPDPVYPVPATFFTEDFERGAPDWRISSEFAAPGAQVRNWTFTYAPERSGLAAYITDPNYTCTTTNPAYRDQTGVMHLESPAFRLPVNATGTRLSFDHRVATEFGYDGGQLMVSVDEGNFVLVPESAFVFNDYNTTFLDSTGNTNPRAGQKAFSGADDRTNLLEASWGTSIVDLTGLASPGQTIRLRWDFSNDNCGGESFFGYGWFVDNVRVYGGLGNMDTPLPSGLYVIRAKHSGKALDVTGASTENGAAVIQWDYWGGSNQQWQVEAVGDGYYKLTARHSGKALDVAGISLENGAPISQWDYNGGDNQRWKIEQVADGYYKLTTKHSGKALDVFGVSSENGASVTQWDDNGGDNQRWSFSPIQ